jgi:hypothetical protein
MVTSGKLELKQGSKALYVINALESKGVKFSFMQE